MMKTPFDVPWDDLNLESLKAFLSSPVNEGLTWEAKGGHVRKEHVRAAVCAFANSELGGYLVVGASQNAHTKVWAVDGYDFPIEPELWITDCLDNGGVDPLPSTSTRSWPVGDGLWAAVVQVYPAAITPCLTSSGEVFQRLSGKSQRVIDASSLRRLFERGEAARLRAMSTAEAGRDDLVYLPPEGIEVKIAVSVASPSLPPDVSAVVFRESTYAAIQRTLNGSQRARMSGPGAEVSQHAVTVSAHSLAAIPDSTVRVGRHGSVAVAVTDPLMDSGLQHVALESYRPELIWSAAMSILRELGGYGPSAMAMHLSHPNRGHTSIARWTEVRDPTAGELASIVREAKRALGRPAWEPQ